MRSTKCWKIWKNCAASITRPSATKNWGGRTARARAEPQRQFAISNTFCALMLFYRGGEGGPGGFPAFKAGDAFLRGTGGGFDFHTPPPTLANVYADISLA